MRSTLALIFLAILAGAVSPASAQVFPRAHSRSYPTGSGPFAIVALDLNRDGNVDFAVTNRGADSLSVRLGDGRGNFGARVDHLTGDDPAAIAAGDLTLDGIPDLVVANRGTGTVSLFIGHPPATFSSKVDFPVGNQPSSVALGDVTGDGRLDAVVANFGASTITVLSGGPGAGLTGGSFTLPTGTGPSGIALADLNRDGIDDIVTVNSLADSMSVRLSDSGGVGARSDIHAGGSGPNAIVLGDLNKDGNVDAVVTHKGASTISVLYGNAGGVLTLLSTKPANAAPSALVLGDVNHDGMVDLMVTHEGSNLLTSFAGNATGGFEGKQSFQMSDTTAFALAVADVDGDGRRDLLIPTAARPAVWIFFGNILGAFGPKTEYVSGTQPSAVAVADLDGNGTPDAAVTNKFSNTVVVFFNDGTGVFGAGVPYPAPHRPQSIAVGNLDANGTPDLVVGSYSPFDADTNRVAVYLNPGSGVFPPAVEYDKGTGRRSDVAIGEVTGDGNPDVLVLRGFTGTLGILAGNGAGGLGAVATFPVLPYPEAIHLTDLNADGRLDATVTDSDSMISVLLNDGAGGFAARTTYGIGPQPTHVASGDFNGDGKRDLAVTYFNRVVILPGNGLGGFGPRLIAIGTTQALSLDVADVNEDGLLDAVIGEGGSTFAVFHGRGDGTFGAPIGSFIGNTPWGIRLVDLDANGTLDAVSANNAVSTMGVALGRQKTRAALTVTPESSPVGSSVTYTATVTEARVDPGAPTGNVRFFDGFALLGTSPLVNGVATLVQSAAHPWDRSITAEYVGDSRFFGSISRPVFHQNFVPTVGVAPADAPRFGLAPMRNPASGGALMVRFTLPSSMPATLALLDVRGRLLVSKSVGGREPGTHVIDLAAGRSLAPGVYLLRLEQGGEAVTTRTVLLR